MYLRKIQVLLRVILLTILGFISVTALIGGIALFITNGSGMPQGWLAKTVFSSYYIPAIILFGVVGGTHLLAFFALLVRKNIAYEVSAIAGFGLLIWLFVQISIIVQTSWLQTVYFSLGIVELVAIFMLLRTEKLL